MDLNQAIETVEAERLYVIGMHPYDVIRCLHQLADMPAEQILEAAVRGLVAGIHESSLIYEPDTYLTALGDGEMWSDSEALPWLSGWPPYVSHASYVERVIGYQTALRSPDRKLDKFLRKDMLKQARLYVKIL